MKQNQWKKLLEEGKNLIKESLFDDKIYFIDDMLWVAYSPGSGTTKRITDITSFLTDKKDDSHYDYLTKDIVKWADKNNPIAKQKTTESNILKRLYKIPMYTRKKMSEFNHARDFDIWGGKMKPEKIYYMLVTTQHNINIISFFKTKSEALLWIKKSWYN